MEYIIFGIIGFVVLIAVLKKLKVFDRNNVPPMPTPVDTGEEPPTRGPPLNK